MPRASCGKWATPTNSAARSREHCCRAPWLARPTAQIMLSMFELDGRPAAADPRHALARSIARLAALGFTPVMACEIEFYLVRDNDADGIVPLYRPSAGGRQKIDAYGLDRLEHASALFDELFAAARAQGLPAETLMSEYAPGQFEITLHHRPDALRAVDEAILFKRLIKGVAAKHGVTATFMAKPFAAHAGSGLHLHLSLEDEAGRNAFADAAPEGSASPAPGHRGHADDHGRERRDLRAERQFVPPLPAVELRADCAHLGSQQSLGQPARARGRARQPPHRASRRGRRRESVSRGGDRARRCASRHRQGNSIRVRRSSATATTQADRGVCRDLAARARARGAIGVSARMRSAPTFSRCFSRSSIRSATASPPR